MVDVISNDVTVLSGSAFPEKMTPEKIHKDTILAHREIRYLSDSMPFETGQQVATLVNQIEKEGRINAVYTRVVNQVRDKTDVFKRHEEMGILFDVMLGVERAEVEGTKVEWHARDMEFGGGFYKDFNLTRIAAEFPDKKDMLMTFAKDGGLPWALNVYAHEMAHKHHFALNVWQKLKGTYNHLFYGRDRNGSLELREVHANRVGQRPINKLSPQGLKDTLKQVVDKKGKLLYPDLDEKKLEFAIAAIDQMHALKYTVGQIGEFVRNSGEWDAKKRVYPRLQKSIEYRRQEEGLTEGDLEDLVYLDKLQSEAGRLKVQKIAQEELQKAA